MADNIIPKLHSMSQDLSEFCKVSDFDAALSEATEIAWQNKCYWAGGTQWLRDAWLASKFATATNADSVRVVPESPPDFEIEFRSGRVLPFEATIADLPGRQMAKEHIDLARSGSTYRSDPFEKWELRRELVPSSLESACLRKCKNRKYTSDTSLLVYLNLGTYGLWRSEIQRELIEHTKIARHCFHAVWVLWSGEVYRCWPNPFLREEHFRPMPHQLGWARKRYSDKRMLDSVFDACLFEN
jgi:hypothetical protein